MIALHIVALLLVLHFFADFLTQTDWMATNKSGRYGFNEAMAWHIVSYALTFTIGLMVYGLPTRVAVWIVLNAFCHWATDAVTSNVTSILWKKHERHWFFAVIGADQLIHTLTLLATWKWIVG